MDNCGHTVDLGNVEILNKRNIETTEFLEVWHPDGSVTNNHIKINTVCQPTRKVVRKYETKYHARGKNYQNTYADDDRLKVNNQ